MTLIDVSSLSKPASTLIEKISDAVGAVFEPRQIRRIAKAKADAAITTAHADIEITDLHRRAARRWVEEEAHNQQCMEQIAAKTIPQLKENASPHLMEKDWIVNFFDKSRIISDDEMQNLWSRVLAGEANYPGTYSKRTINFLAGIDKRDAECFSRMCRFCWILGDLQAVILIFMMTCAV